VLKTQRTGDASGMIDVLLLGLRTLGAACRERGDLLLENLLLRHQLAVLTRLHARCCTAPTTCTSAPPEAAEVFPSHKRL
jgi:hypothetical protein